ncbi:tetratricopeptide repeat protein [Pseudooctadecabacter sp.]|uniref:tetratricopeptide repeat protein n=1 Tax=Pseudooctadecabacter sp. TaxID=1966338 RepID=UPI0025F557F6|nr:tetratricopeptide repeat protein [Pseudooctadecabacter sp.]
MVRFVPVALATVACLGFSPLWAVAQTAPGDDPLRISVEDGPAFARDLLRAGQPEAALQILDVLLEADPAATSVHLLRARALMALGRPSEARDAGRMAWRTAQSDAQKFSAAFTMADLLAADEAYTRSQLWVRRALQVAPDEQRERLAVTAFRRVRQANPLAVELAFGVAPSDNVNSGNANEAITFAYLPGTLSEIEWLVPADQRPLSGVEVSAQGQVRYRITEAQTYRTSLEFGGFGRTYIMSADAKEAAPDVTGASLSYAQLSFGVLHQWTPQSTNRNYSASLTYSHDWAGGTPLRQDVNLTFGAQQFFENDTRLSVLTSVRFSDRFLSDDVTTYALRGLWTRDFENGQSLGLTGQLAVATSDGTDQAYQAATVGVSYDFGDIGAGFDLRTSWTEQYRVYETSVFDPAGRDDTITTLRVDLGLQNMDFYGFEPVLNVTGRRTASSVPRFDTEGVQIGFDMRSSF